jgi:hypothetical protein
MSNQINNKLTMRQISCETGVSGDYYNEFIGLLTKAWFKGDEGLLISLQKAPIKKYAERYPLEKYEQVITPQNSGRIKRLDEIVVSLNLMSDPNKFSRENFDKLTEEAKVLIYGEKVSESGSQNKP